MNSTSVEPVTQPGDYLGRIYKHPSMISAVKNCLKMGFGNAEICKRTGMPQEIVTKMRSQYEKEKQAI